MAPLILLFLALTYTDYLYTTYMLRKYGSGIELNPVIKWCIKKLQNLEMGILLGMGLPTCLILIAGTAYPPFLEPIVFARLILFFLQANNARSEIATHRSGQTTAS